MLLRTFVGEAPETFGHRETFIRSLARSNASIARIVHWSLCNNRMKMPCQTITIQKVEIIQDGETSVRSLYLETLALPDLLAVDGTKW